MAASFLHGVETFEQVIGPASITQVRSGVIFLVGTAPIQNLAVPAFASVNVPQLCNSPVDDLANFGPDTPGYTIPAALAAIRSAAKGNPTVVVVNVFDPVTMQTAGAPDPTLVSAANIIGAQTAAGRTGLMLAQDCMTIYGFAAKILIAPVFCTQATVAAAMSVQAGITRGVYLVDVPIGTTVAQVISSRGTAGPLALNLADPRCILLYPMLTCADPNSTTGGTRLEPYSQHFAGLMSATDNNLGYWWSTSNQVIPNIVGTEIPISARLNDASCDANQLNSVGVVTVFTAYGTGFRAWGNRSTAFPGSTLPTVFYCVRRTADTIEDSIEQASLEFMDHPLTGGLIDTILETINSFLRSLIGNGAITTGAKAFIDPTQNPASQLAAGQLVVGYQFMPPPPLERITYQSFININLISSILPG